MPYRDGTGPLGTGPIGFRQGGCIPGFRALRRGCALTNAKDERAWLLEQKRDAETLIKDIESRLKELKK